MSNNPLVSVIVPVYNVEKYLSYCVDSIINQSYKNLEIVLVDDGSTDNSFGICNDYAKIDSRVKVIHKKNGGVSSARNAGIQNSHGDFYSFIDSDDLIHNCFIESLLNACLNNDVDVAICGFNEISCNDEIYFSKYSINSFARYRIVTKEELFKSLYSIDNIKTIISTNKLYKSCVFDSIRYPEGKNYEDEVVIHTIIETAGKFAWTDERYYFYRLSPNSITHKSYTIKNLDEIWSKEQRLAFFEEYGYKELYQKQLYVYCSRIIYHIHQVKKLGLEKPEKIAIISELKKKYRKSFKKLKHNICSHKKYLRLLFYYVLFV